MYYFLEVKKPIQKTLSSAAGLSNSSCKMPLHTYYWRQIAVCDDKAPLRAAIDRLPLKEQSKYRILSNDPIDCQEDDNA